MRTASRAALALAILAPLSLAPLTISTAAQAAVPVLTCDGHATATMSPGLTDTPTDQTITTTSKLGTNDDLLGLIGNSVCKSPDSNQTAAKYPGATMKINVTESQATCDNQGTEAITGGEIDWSDGEVSPLGAGTEFITQQEHGDGIRNVSLPINDGPFAGHTVTVEVNADSGASNACETNGIKNVAGTTGINID